MRLVEFKGDNNFNSPRVFVSVQDFNNGDKELWSCVPEADGCNSQRAAALLCGSIH